MTGTGTLSQRGSLINHKVEDMQGKGKMKLYCGPFFPFSFSLGGVLLLPYGLMRSHEGSRCNAPLILWWDIPGMLAFEIDSGPQTKEF